MILATCTAVAALTIQPLPEEINAGVRCSMKPEPGPANEQPMKIKDSLSAAAQYEVPQGWAEEFSVNQGDPQAILSRDLHKITVRLSGGEKSRYETADDFLAGFEARSIKDGKPAEKIGAVDVSGMSVMLYRREVPVSFFQPPPDTSGPWIFTKEEFCVVPAGKMFFVLSYSYGDSIPDPDYDGHEVWRKFLKDFRILGYLLLSHGAEQAHMEVGNEKAAELLKISRIQ